MFVPVDQLHAELTPFSNCLAGSTAIRRAAEHELEFPQQGESAVALRRLNTSQPHRG